MCTPVAPLVGAWIEISDFLQIHPDVVTSLPSWERGLKSFHFLTPPAFSLSLPSWERGLKSLHTASETHCKWSLPSWERGLKLDVATGNSKTAESLPSWERGLKSPPPEIEGGVGGRSPRGSVD